MGFCEGNIRFCGAQLELFLANDRIIAQRDVNSFANGHRFRRLNRLKLHVGHVNLSPGGNRGNVAGKLSPDGDNQKRANAFAMFPNSH